MQDREKSKTQASLSHESSKPNACVVREAVAGEEALVMDDKTFEEAMEFALEHHSELLRKLAE